MRSLDEYKLVQGCQRGDPEAFSQLVKQYKDPLYNAAYRILADAEEAADATQSSFLKIFERIDSYDSSRPLFSWLYRIALNEAIDRSRKLSRLTALDETWLKDDAAGIEETLDGAMFSKGLQQALMSLPVDARVVIVMKHINGMSYTEIAEVLEIADKTVKSRLYSARQQLKARLEEMALFSRFFED